MNGEIIQGMLRNQTAIKWRSKLIEEIGPAYIESDSDKDYVGCPECGKVSAIYFGRSLDDPLTDDRYRITSGVPLAIAYSIKSGDCSSIDVKKVIGWEGFCCCNLCGATWREFLVMVSYLSVAAWEMFFRLDTFPPGFTDWIEGRDAMAEKPDSRDIFEAFLSINNEIKKRRLHKWEEKINEIKLLKSG